MASLYELSAGYESLLDSYDAADTEEDREAILAMLADVQGDIGDKAEAYAKIIRTKEEEAKAFKAEADRLTKRRQSAENLVARLKAALLDTMKMTEIVEIRTSIGKWKIQNNPPSCEVVDVNMVPKRYRTPQPDKVDRKGILDAYKQTGEIPSGVEIKQEQGIRFR